MGFITEKDPILAMVGWVAYQVRPIEDQAKVGAEKGKHSRYWKAYFPGARGRRMNTQLWTIYLYVPKLRKGGYVPFFVMGSRRSELALAALGQEAFIKRVSARRIERPGPGAGDREYLGLPGRAAVKAGKIWHEEANVNNSHNSFIT